MKQDNILQLENLYKNFNLEAGFFSKKQKIVYAVNDLSLSLKRGSIYGIVGESGCGKTTTARLIIQMYKASSGNILFKSKDSDNFVNVSSLNKKELKLYREQVKYIFQDPARSLNPRISVYDILTSGLKYSSKWKNKQAMQEAAIKIIQEVGLSEADLSRYPTEFSGGQRQRISIARGLIMNPELLICDEVVSALDVSIQGQIINLLQDLRQKHNLSYLFITHDLKVACYFSDIIGVMYRGILVEEAEASSLYKNAVHPYTKLLFEGIKDSNIEVKSTLQQENCCCFAHRCPYADEKCKNSIPQMREIAENHKVRCFHI
jgi:oligopeptide/dipeptide ABC transporter ATP-binding protein